MQRVLRGRGRIDGIRGVWDLRSPTIGELLQGTRRVEDLQT
jgi:hypothetical protein